MSVCTHCGKNNRERHRFCLDCGTALVRTPAPATPAAHDATSRPPEVSRRHPATDRQPRPGLCPQCAADNPPENRFCAACGFQLRAAVEAPSSIGTMSQGRPIPLTQRALELALLHGDGTVADAIALTASGTRVGRDRGAIFSGDTFLSTRHCTISIGSGAASGVVHVRDDDSLNGVYLKLAAQRPHLLAPYQVFRIGQEIIRFEPLETQAPDEHGVELLGGPIAGYVGRIVLLLGRTSTGMAVPVPEAGLHIGRERGQVVFPEDGYISGTHCRLSSDQGRVYLTDLGSSNGTFVRIREQLELSVGDTLLLGQQLYRIQTSR